MKVWELIERLNELPRSATLYVQANDPVTEQPMLWPVTGIGAADSPEYGSAIVIDIEE